MRKKKIIIKWRVKGKWRRLIQIFLFMIRVDPSPILFYFYFFIGSESIRPGLAVWVDPVRLAKMFVCPVPKISQVMMKWCRRALHLCRFTLWNNGLRATQLGRLTLWHYGRLATQLSRFVVTQLTLSFTTRREIYFVATQLGRFTLWHCDRLGAQLSRFTLWYNRRWASQLAGKFTLWHKEDMKA